MSYLFVSAVIIGFWLGFDWHRNPMLPKVQINKSKSDVSLIQKFRYPLVVLLGIGIWCFFGDIFGLLAGIAGAWFSYRVLGQQLTPQQLAAQAELVAQLPIFVGLVSVSLRAGAALSTSLQIVTAALGGSIQSELAPYCAQLKLGADPTQLWQQLATHPQLGNLGSCFYRAHRSGASIVTAIDLFNQQILEQQHAVAIQLAKQISTKAALPMGGCFLPAFILLAVVPFVASIILELGFS